jgi:hypothetical protein
LTYLQFARVVQVGQAATAADLEVNWTFGNQMQDAVQIIWNVVGWSPPGRLAAQVPIHESAPTSQTITVVAPAPIEVLVCPRLLDASGVPRDQMPDDQGVERYWEEYAVRVVLNVTATSSHPGVQTRPAPRIRPNPTVELSAITIEWDAEQSYDFYNLRYGRRGEPPQGESQYEVRMSGRYGWFRQANLRPDTDYHFSVEGCNDVLFGSSCSDWSEPFLVRTLSPEPYHGPQWHSFWRIGDPAPASTFNKDVPVSCIVGPSGHLDVFAVGNDGGVWTNFWG